MARQALVSLFTALVLLTAGCGSGESSDHAAPRSGTATAPSQELTDLRDIMQLRSLFNSRSGEPRLILLVSPT